MNDRYITLNLSFAREINNFPGIGYQTNDFKIEVVVRGNDYYQQTVLFILKPLEK
ncbi:MAG: hypothetical protein ACXIUD_00315 [Mongoliitalea sp.]